MNASIANFTFWLLNQIIVNIVFYYVLFDLFQDVLPENEQSAYSEPALTLAKLYVFDEEVNPEAVQKLEEFGGEKQGALGIIYVDV